MKKRIILLFLILISFSLLGTGCGGRDALLSSPPALTITNGTMRVCYIHLFGDKVATLGPGESTYFGRYYFFSFFANTHRSKRITFLAMQPKNNALKIAEKSFNFSTYQYVSYQWTIRDQDFR